MCEKHNVNVTPVKANEAFNKSNFEDFLYFASKLGLNTLKDVQRFAKEHGDVTDDELLAALKNAVAERTSNVTTNESKIVSFKTRRGLSEALSKFKDGNTKVDYKVKRSKTEGYRYDLILESEDQITEARKALTPEEKLKQFFEGDPEYFDKAAEIIIGWYLKEDNDEGIRNPDYSDILDLLDASSNQAKREIVAKAIGSDASFVFDDDDEDEELEEAYSENTGDDFKDKMGFLTNDELEAIAGYKEVIEFFKEKGIDEDKIMDRLLELQADEEEHLEELKELYLAITGEEMVELPEEESEEPEEEPEEETNEDIAPLQRKLGNMLLPKQSKPAPKKEYELYWFDNEDNEGDPIFKSFTSEAEAMQWYNDHVNDEDKFNMAEPEEFINECIENEPELELELEIDPSTIAPTDEALTETVDENNIYIDIYAEGTEWEAIKEHLVEEDKVPEALYYEDLPVVVGVNPGVETLPNGDPGYPDEAIEGTSDWEYKYNIKQDDFILFVEKNYDVNNFTLKDLKEIDRNKFESFLKDLYLEEAKEDAWDNYVPEEPDYDRDYFEEVEFDAEAFDADLSEYFKEAYESPIEYKSNSGVVDKKGNIMLEGVIKLEDVESNITFTLTPLNAAVTESLDATMLQEQINKQEYKVTNNLSEEVFTFDFTCEK